MNKKLKKKLTNPKIANTIPTQVAHSTLILSQMSLNYTFQDNFWRIILYSFFPFLQFSSTLITNDMSEANQYSNVNKSFESTIYYNNSNIIDYINFNIHE
jgi:hypothetical protein